MFLTDRKNNKPFIIAAIYFKSKTKKVKIHKNKIEEQNIDHNSTATLDKVEAYKDAEFVDLISSQINININDFNINYEDINDILNFPSYLLNVPIFDP